MDNLIDNALFITGTGTDVGKTVVTAGLCAHYCSLGHKVAVMKPVLSGLDGSGKTDLDFVREVAAELGFHPSIVPGPYAFKYPASPHLAARMEGAEVDVELIKRSIVAGVAANVGGVTLVEGAGGLCVPLREDYLFLDLLRELRMPVVLVCSLGLGSINHALLSVAAMKAAGVPVAGAVLNGLPENPGPIEADNAAYLSARLGIHVFGTVKKLETAGFAAALLGEFRRLAQNLPAFPKLPRQ